MAHAAFIYEDPHRPGLILVVTREGEGPLAQWEVWRGRPGEPLEHVDGGLGLFSSSNTQEIPYGAGAIELTNFAPTVGAPDGFIERRQMTAVTDAEIHVTDGVAVVHRGIASPYPDASGPLWTRHPQLPAVAREVFGASRPRTAGATPVAQTSADPVAMPPLGFRPVGAADIAAEIAASLQSEDPLSGNIAAFIDVLHKVDMKDLVLRREMDALVDVHAYRTAVFATASEISGRFSEVQRGAFSTLPPVGQWLFAQEVLAETAALVAPDDAWVAGFRLAAAHEANRAFGTRGEANLFIVPGKISDIGTIGFS